MAFTLFPVNVSITSHKQILLNFIIIFLIRSDIPDKTLKDSLYKYYLKVLTKFAFNESSQFLNYSWGWKDKTIVSDWIAITIHSHTVTCVVVSRSWVSLVFKCYKCYRLGYKVNVPLLRSLYNKIKKHHVKFHQNPSTNFRVIHLYKHDKIK